MTFLLARPFLWFRFLIAFKVIFLRLFIFLLTDWICEYLGLLFGNPLLLFVFQLQFFYFISSLKIDSVLFLKQLYLHNLKDVMALVCHNSLKNPGTLLWNIQNTFVHLCLLLGFLDCRRLPILVKLECWKKNLFFRRFDINFLKKLTPWASLQILIANQPM